MYELRTRLLQTSVAPVKYLGSFRCTVTYDIGVPSLTLYFIYYAVVYKSTFYLIKMTFCLIFHF